MAVLPLSELGMYGTALDDSASWAICALCQHPIHQPEPGYTREQASEDLARHLHELHGAGVREDLIGKPQHRVDTASAVPTLHQVALSVEALIQQWETATFSERGQLCIQAERSLDTLWRVEGNRWASEQEANQPLPQAADPQEA
ncbi:MAG TPA: hypothetical protein VGH72_33755 [Pseudonocardia sp.]